MSEYQKLRCLSNEVSYCAPDLFSRFVIIFLQHLLADALPFVQALRDRGCTTLYALGIPYSTKTAVVDAIGATDGCSVRAPADYPFPNDIEAILAEAFAEAARTKRRVLIIEDGPYLVPRLARGGFDLSLCAGAVQQTRRGLNRYKELQGSGGRLPVPAVEIADTSLKNQYEARCVAPALIDAVTALVGIARPNEDPFRGKTVTIVGASGTIGEQLVQLLVEAGAQVQVAERSYRQLIRFTATSYERHNIRLGSVEELIPSTDLLIGCTGAAGAVNDFALTKVKDGAILASASSGNEEIDVVALEGMSEGRRPSDVLGDGPARIPAFTTYEVRHGGGPVRRVTLLYGGYPVNFWSQSLAASGRSDPVIALLFSGAAFIARSGTLEPRIYVGDEALQREQARISVRWVLR